MPVWRERLFDRLRSGDFFDRRRILAYGGIALAGEILVFLFLVAGTHGWVVPLERPVSTDFVSFYAAGNLADAGTPQLAYDHAAHYAAEERATEPGIAYQFFYYPPVFMLLCALLARLPYLAAFVLFEAASLTAYLLVARAILREHRWTVLVPLAAFPAVFWTLGLGQNAFLTAALFGGATLLVDRRPLVAGLLFGALVYKPHFGLLIPIALAAGGHWRVFAAAAASSAALLLLSAAAFGWQSWHDFLTVFLASGSTYDSGRIDFAGMDSPFAALRLLGASVAVSYGVQVAATVLAAGFVAWVWRRGLGLPVRAASLAAAALVAVPVALVYDLVLAAVAGAWLIRGGRETGFFAWEKTILVALFLVPLLSRSLGTVWHLPLAPLGVLALLALAARHAWIESASVESAGAGSDAAVTLLAGTKRQARLS